MNVANSEISSKIVGSFSLFCWLYGGLALVTWYMNRFGILILLLSSSEIIILNYRSKRRRRLATISGLQLLIAEKTFGAMVANVQRRCQSWLKYDKIVVGYKQYYYVGKCRYLNTNNNIMLLITIPKAKRQLARNIRNRRLSMNLTQRGLSERSGVPLSTLRCFEQKGSISMESFLRLLLVVGGIEELIAATRTTPKKFSSIDDVLKTTAKKERQRGRQQ